jgi:hypothetical protein
MQIIIPTLREDKVPSALKILKDKNLLENNHCIVCKKQISKKNIGGFIPHNNKVAIICDDPECYLKSVSIRRKVNGNGSL